MSLFLWNDYETPVRKCGLFNHHPGHHSHHNHNDLLSSFWEPFPTRQCIRHSRPWMNLNEPDSKSEVVIDKDKFQVMLDVQQFSPNEISVKTVDNQIIVEAKHEERPDEHGYISRHFVRRYQLPSDTDANDITSKLSSDGVLTIGVARKAIEPPNGERIIPIKQTGPAKDNRIRKRSK